MMNKGLYAHLAISNIRSNGRIYLPYIIAGICSVMMFYMVNALSRNSALYVISGGDTLSGMLWLGTWVAGIFLSIFLLYTNSFIIKRRKKELGLYNILGMEKKHIAKVMLFETLYVSIFTIAAGLVLGIIFNKLAFLGLLKLLGQSVVFGFEVPVEAILNTLILFFAVYIVGLLVNLRHVSMAKPIELLKGGEVGEKEPKTRWILAVVGVLTLAAGYYLAVTTENAITGVMYFFPAVFLVIIGTYCLFTFGSIAILKMLRSNKKYYYKPKHFTSVSGMIYRMKQNAVGLANICILSTMVLVTLSTTVCLYVGMEDLLRIQYPREIELTSYPYSSSEEELTSKDKFDMLLESNEKMNEAVNEVLAEHSIAPQNFRNYCYLSISAKQDKSFFDTSGSIDSVYTGNSVRSLYFVTLDDYNKMLGKHETLLENEVLVYYTNGTYEYDTLEIFGESYKVKGVISEEGASVFDPAVITSSYYVVVRDMNEIEQLNDLQRAEFSKNASRIRVIMGFDLDASDDEKEAIYREISDKFTNDDNVSITSRTLSRGSFVGTYGGIFFVGVFLGILFVMAAVLIIYYKQVSEGYDDRGRFEIMQKVGMSRSEVRSSIRSQILTVFFLPLVAAFIHTAFAFPMTSKMLTAFSMTNTQLFMTVNIVFAAFFAVFYALIYMITARTYYKIVS